MKKIFKDKILLITGGTGSFGNAVLRRLIKFNFKEIRIFSRDEKKQEDMRNFFKNDILKFYIGDVRNYESVYDCMQDVNYVFHAAALKQVPSCEFYPLEAVRTNIFGADNVMRAAIENKVQRLILLSTDKAVYPINSMGLTKSLMEKNMIAKCRQYQNKNTIICSTRYGNVMGSRGSVIPLFIKQIKKNNYITITNPNMTRFLMTLDQSVDLVLHAFKNGKSGDIFVQKSPACSMLDLAKALKKIYKKNNKEKIIGTRHGEKLYETLVSQEEMLNAKEEKDFFVIPSDKRDLNYDKYFVKGTRDIEKIKSYTSHNTKRLKIDEIIAKLKKVDFVNNA